MEIAIILITHNRLDSLKKCLSSILAAISKSKLKFTYTAYIGVNGQDIDTQKYLESTEIPGMHWQFWIEPKRLGAARNILLKKKSPDWVYFLDDDVELDQNHFLTFEIILKKYKDLSIIGGPNQHLRKQNECQRAQEEVLSSYFVSGPFSARYQKGKVNLDSSINQLILCNLFIKFSTNLFFNESLVGAEENELLKRLGKSHRPFGFFPELAVHHQRRNTYAEFTRQCIQIGKGRGQLESLNHPILFPLFFLWLFIFLLVFGSLFAFCFVLLNYHFKSSKQILINVTIRLYYGYIRGLVTGCFLKMPLSETTLLTRH